MRICEGGSDVLPVEEVLMCLESKRSWHASTHRGLDVPQVEEVLMCLES